MPVNADTYSESSRYMAQLANHAMKRKAAGEDDPPSGRSFKRSRSGCFTCRLRRKKCDEGRPSCAACIGLNVKCDYDQPNWWSSPELRVLQKGKMKDNIKQNKVIVKNHHAFLAEGNPYNPQQSPQAFQSASFVQQQQLQQPLPQMQIQTPQLQQQFPQIQLDPLQLQQLQLPQIQLDQLPDLQLQLPQIQLDPLSEPQPQEQLPQIQLQLQLQQQQEQQQLQLQLQLQEQQQIQLQLQQEQEQQQLQLQQEQQRQEQQRQEQQKREQQMQEQRKREQQKKEQQKKEQQRKEQQRKEQQRKEQQKKEQQQKEQQRKEQQKKEQEKQKDKGKGKEKQQPLYQVDVTTERQLFINDVQARKETSVTTFNTHVPPQIDEGGPSMSKNERTSQKTAMGPPPVPFRGYPGPGPDPGPDPFTPPGQPEPEEEEGGPSIIIEDDAPLLCHFIDNVLRLFFPISEAHQGGEDDQRIRAILYSLEHNQSYFHCCLSVSAMHLKSAVKVKGKGINYDILRHRCEAVSTLCDALRDTQDYDRILDSSLAMIFFHCAVATPEKDGLPDIAWYDHFEAVINLLGRLDYLNPAATIHHINPPFSASIATWIDILGATMLGRPPQFAETYRVKNLSDLPSGLYQLMGCEDRVMYILSEIACLDAMKLRGTIGEIAVCAQVASLGRQLENTEPRDPKLEHPYNPTSGEFRAENVFKTITAIFRIAARIYLCSLVPGFDRHQESNTNLIEAGTRALDYLPDGPNGYDRCIVWPLLIIGTYSVPTSSVRLVLHRRMIEIGDDNDFGNWSRLYRVLVEIWRRSDGHLNTVSGKSQTTTAGAQIMQQTRLQAVHWRTVLIEKGWDYLLM
ncbi:hypothetical protein UA08_08312 [Talaromyces atroroseus]|uniref:Zn(2)-C6 fungal-type domain-containing protein n=1 Tax=Talaromyces atroroseus TaxID=1441469 RepID=A0A225AF42_TALAT|nr:hypothetical protein UA08_08312 [Talaromyces atroroseus]OKL56664.1 hypothetical protein UA08_08312 [Talaromyces atroroseus]